MEESLEWKRKRPKSGHLVEKERNEIVPSTPTRRINRDSPITTRQSRLDWGISRFQASLNRVVDLSAMHRDLARGFDAQPHLVAANLNHNDLDVVVDDDAFVLFS
jgi:hypothetical protein